ncbi:MAG: prepilin-type N-terminal cleavage/methylation domain-containing protein [Verrucomicrobiia bacterium]
MKATETKTSGFTLTELLVVIATVAILAATLLPALAATKLRELSAQCLGNLRQLTMAATVYQTENKSIPWGGNQLWPASLNTAQNTGADLLCPLASTPNPEPGRGTGNFQGTANQAWTWNVLSDPNNPASPTVVTNGSYGLNGWLYQWDGALQLWALAGSWLPVGCGTNFFGSTAAVTHPSFTPMFVDALWPDMWPYAQGPDTLPTWWLYDENYQAGNNTFSYKGMARCCLERHGERPPLTGFVAIKHTVHPLPGGVNVSFVDGHASYTGLDNLWLLYWNRYAVPQPRQ